MLNIFLIHAEHLHGETLCRGVGKFFKTLVKLASSSGFFTLQVRKLAKNVERVSEREKKLTRLARGFAFLLANPEF
jgi:hypothetical protein